MLRPFPCDKRGKDRMGASLLPELGKENFVCDGSNPSAERHMSIKIEKKIAKYRVEKPEDKAAAAAKEAAEPRKEANVVWMHEKLERPDVLIGSTYKIK